MDSRLLRYFLTVADHRTISAAAKTLHITQPALSRQVKQLESQLNLKLFHRAGTRLALTSEGRQFLSAARGVLQQHAHVESFAASLAAGQMHSVSIAAPRTSLIDVVAPFVATFSAADPAPEVSEIIVTSDMKQSVADFDLIVAPQRPSEKVSHRALASLPVWAYVHPGHLWAEAERTEINLDELVKNQVIVVPPEHKSRRVFDAAVALTDLAPSSIVEVSHGRVAQALAAARRGVAVVTDDRHFGLHPLKISSGSDHMQIHLYAAWRREHHATTALESIAERLRTFCLDRYDGETAFPQPTGGHCAATPVIRD